MWRWVELELAERKRFPLPPDIPLENMPEAFRKEAAALAGKSSESPLEESQDTFRYAEVKTQLCVDEDLNFCECLARAHGRLLENSGEKIFLRGNAFLSKIAKAIFEQDGELFADACGKHKDESYFRECAKTLKQWSFTVGEGEKIGRKSWLGLYEVVLLLTGEYLATKCKLPKVSATECRGNSDEAATLEIILAKPGSAEEDLKDAALAPIKPGGLYGPSRLDDSSDCIEAGELFYDFLGKNFPFKGSEKELAGFMASIYGDDACKDLGWLREALSSNSPPRPEIKIDAMEKENSLGSHEGETICLNQRLVLDAVSLRDPKDGFILLVAMLIEYGHFLSHVLHDKAGKPIGDSKNAGRAFAYRFMECSEAGLFNADFEFADFTAPDSKGGKQKFTAKVSGLGREQREMIFYSLGTESIWEGEA
jgi:hypothetical protein